MYRRGVLLVCPFMTGCLCYGYPSITQTPAIAVPALEVRAFRVRAENGFYGAFIAGAFLRGNRVEEIPTAGSEVPPQKDCHFVREFLAFPIWAYNYHRQVYVQLYRRGFEPVKVEARSCLLECWRNQPITVSWKKTQNVAAREKTLEDLSLLDTPYYHDPQFREFLANEYTALANDPSADDETRTRLLDKASSLRSKGSP